MADDDSVKHISSSDDFDNLLASTRYVIADFYADWCGPCKQIAPMYAQFAKKFSIPNFMAFAKVNVDTVQPIAQRYNVSAMPTFLFFKDGSQVAVNGAAMIRGADPRSLSAAAEKMGKLAKEKADAAAAEAEEK